MQKWQLIAVRKQRERYADKTSGRTIKHFVEVFTRPTGRQDPRVSYGNSLDPASVNSLCELQI